MCVRYFQKHITNANYISYIFFPGRTALLNVWRYVRSRRESRLYSKSGDLGSLLQEIHGTGERHRYGRQFHIHDAYPVLDRISAAAFRAGGNAEELSCADGSHYGVRDTFQAYTRYDVVSAMPMVDCDFDYYVHISVKAALVSFKTGTDFSF